MKQRVTLHHCTQIAQEPKDICTHDKGFQCINVGGGLPLKISNGATLHTKTVAKIKY